MARYLIDKTELLKVMLDIEEECEERMTVPSFALAYRAVREQSTVDAAPVVQGEWIKHKINPEAMRLFHQDGIAEAMGENSIFWTCSECKSWGTPAHKYCQNCGAKMDGGDE